MSYYWLIFTFTWLGGARPQYINSGSPSVHLVGNLDRELNAQIPYTSYFDIPDVRENFSPTNDRDIVDTYNRFSLKDLYQSEELQRQRRTVETGKEDVKGRRWQPNLLDTDRTYYFEGDDKNAVTPFIVQGVQGYLKNLDENKTDLNTLDAVMDKKSFSPWGGKRDSNPFVEHTWTWKRSANIKEPSMPKRVRFSPWGGKRSGQVIYKPGTKGSKIIFSSAVPELTKIVSNYSPNGERMNLAGYQILPILDKRHPFRVLALSAKVDGGRIKEAMPFRDFMEVLPKFFKPGHPYADVNIKRDGKRKVKFSAWGGKRSPPIIGPIWTPAFQLTKDYREYMPDDEQTVKFNN